MRLRSSHYSPARAKSLRNCDGFGRVIHSELSTMVTRSKKSAKKSGREHARLSPRQRKPAVAFVGAGRLGTALAQALSSVGYRVEAVVTRRQTSARRAAKAIGKNTVGMTVSQLKRPARGQADRLSLCELIVISIPDDAVAPVAEQLSVLFDAEIRRRGRAPARRVALHTSGALSSDVLSPLRQAGFAIGSLHPLVSISDARTQSDAFRRAFFATEGDDAALRAAKSIVQNLGGQSFKISPRAKALYHAAAVTASGHVVALFDIALEMLASCGLSRRRARQILLPLLESTARNLATSDPASALTGTFARGDVSTAKRHLASIRSRKLRDALAAYILLGQRSLLLAKQRGPRASGLDEIAEILAARVKSSSQR